MAGIMLITSHALFQFITIALWDKLGTAKATQTEGPGF